MNLGSVDHTAALTRPLPLQPSGYYTPPVIIGLEPMCTFVGGINAPKRLTLKTSDGLQQYELLKGKDDIRQDAVMEQVCVRRQHGWEKGMHITVFSNKSYGF